MKPRISIISPSLNTGRFLESTVASIAGQSFRSYEHIVIDGGSTDETLDILGRHPEIRWISEKDNGYLDAFNKGLALSKGEYVMSCCISDGYLDRRWLERCAEVLDRDPEVSLVWGFPRYLGEDGRLGAVSHANFRRSPAPQKKDFIFYWLRKKIYLPEGNFCVRRDVMRDCLPAYPAREEIDTFLEFNYRFNRNGYLPYFLPVVANFGRVHGGQRNENMARLMAARLDNYNRKVAAYLEDIVKGRAVHCYRDGKGQFLPGRVDSSGNFWKGTRVMLKYSLGGIRLRREPECL